MRNKRYRGKSRARPAVLDILHQRELNSKRPTIVLFLDPTKPLQPNHKNRQARTVDRVLIQVGPKHFRGGCGG